jgi:hypothetical protein
MERSQRVEPGEQDPNVHTSFLTLVAIVFVCLVAFGYILFPRHDPSLALGPGATATPKTGGGGPPAPTATVPANPGGNTAR